MPAYRVSGYGRNGLDERSVFVRASSRDAAECVGKYWLRVTTGRRYRAVSVSEDHPERDYQVRQYVREVQS
jgi:hypothetical protein